MSICVPPKYNWHKKVYLGLASATDLSFEKSQSLSSFGLDVQKNRYNDGLYFNNRKTEYIFHVMFLENLVSLI